MTLTRKTLRAKTSVSQHMREGIVESSEMFHLHVSALNTCGAELVYFLLTLKHDLGRVRAICVGVGGSIL